MTGKVSAKGRLVQTFKFLKQLNELRNPIPRDMSSYADVLRLDSWPIHPFITVRRGDRQEEDEQEAPGAELEPVIRIKRARLTPCPKPPRVLDGWLKPGWQAVQADVDVLQARNFPDTEMGSVTVEFLADQERVIALDIWNTARTKWVEAERPAVAARQLFERIHALWTKMQREGDRLELVLADGMLSVDEHLVRHPVLLQRVSLEFEPSGPEFRFETGTEKIELHRALLRLVPTIAGKMIAFFDKELETEAVEPLGGESTAGFLRRLVQGLFNNGEFLEGNTPSDHVDRPIIWRDPVIFSRPRTAGLSTTLDHIIEDLEEEDTKVPEGLARIVGVETERPEPLSNPAEGGKPSTPASAEPDILFSNRRTKSSMKSRHA